MRDADERFLDRLRTEIEPAVATWAVVDGLDLEEVEGHDGVRIVIALRARTGPAHVVVEGDSLIDAAARLPERIVEARLGLAFREVVQGPRA